MEQFTILLKLAMDNSYTSVYELTDHGTLFIDSREILLLSCLLTYLLT